MDALTPQERAALNAWIAEHVYGAQWYDNDYLGPEYEALRFKGPGHTAVARRIKETKEVVGAWGLDYDKKWKHAGPLFDRYEFTLERWPFEIDTDNIIYRVSVPIPGALHYDDEQEIVLAEGTTGPEAIAKAVKHYEEQKRT